MIEWIVTGSALILLVLALRRLVRERVGPRLRYALWGLVLLRLLLPGTLWESRASVMAPAPVREISQAVERIPRDVQLQPDGSAVVWESIPGGTLQHFIPAEAVRSGQAIPYDGWPSQTEASVEALRRQVDVRNILLLIWLAGAAAMGVFLLAVNLAFHFRLQKRRRTVGLYHGLWVFTADGLPCLSGLFRPAIYLTPDLEDGAREHVLAHEYTHFRQGDHIWSVLRGVCLALHWYNPLVWLAAAASRRDCELSCDAGAVKRLGEALRADYGRTLVELATHRTAPAALFRCDTTMTGSALKDRIALLVRRPRTTPAAACLVAAVCAAFAVCTFSRAADIEDERLSPGQPPDLPAQEDDGLRDDLPAGPFRSILADFAATASQSIGDLGEDAGWTLADNYYAICDVNGDGQDELITQLNSTYTAGQTERIYSADGTVLLEAYPNLTYYSNGAIAAGWSHNQGRAGERLWPYTLYRFDQQTGLFQHIAMVDGWDLSLGGTYDGRLFPQTVDEDGDGFVYYIMEEDYVLDNPVDGAAYEAWRDACLGGADILEIPYVPLTEEMLAALQQDR